MSMQKNDKLTTMLPDTELWRIVRLNPIALRMAKTLWSFGHSECNWVKVYDYTSMFFCHVTNGNNICDFLFASLDNKTFKENRDAFLKERICFYGR